MARKKCNACHRPIERCLCGFIQPQHTNLPILIVQHPDESLHPFTTSYLAHLGASSVRLCCAIDLTEFQCRSMLQVTSVDQLALLYIDHHYDEHEALTIDCMQAVSSDRIDKISALVVLDGTWRNTRELLLRNQWLTRLTTLSLENFDKSEYIIRKGTGDTICTIEAIANLLRLIQPSFQPSAYLEPMRELVRQQTYFQFKADQNKDSAD